jgi:hypothetical protein
MPHVFLVLPTGKYLNPKPSIVFFIFLCYAHLFISSMWENVQISKGKGLQKASSYKRESSQLTMTKSMDLVTIVGVGVQLG